MVIPLLELSYVNISQTCFCFSLKLQQGTWIPSTVLSPTSSLPPWDGSGPSQAPAALALPNFPTSTPLFLFRPVQVYKVSMHLSMCTLSEKESGGYTLPKQKRKEERGRY